MEIRILDEHFIELTVVDRYESFIWTDRYNECGDFELYSSVNEKWVNYIHVGNYLTTTDSDRMMIIEGYEVTTSIEDGRHIKVTGRSLESILGRRIVWAQTVVSGSIQTIIKKLIDDSIIDPADQERKIPNFIFKESTDPELTKTIGEAQYTGTNVYNAIKDLCVDYKVGFKITLNENFEFVFELFRGQDRSVTVTFSTEYNNLLSSDYTNDFSNYCNVTRVAGEGEGNARTMVTVGNVSGLDRIELFTDARDLSSKGTTASNYLNQLAARGRAKLAEKSITEGFQGEVEPNSMYKYGVDYYIGDLVRFEDIYGNYGTPRVSEFIITNDEGNGYRCYPTFLVEGQ